MRPPEIDWLYLSGQRYDLQFAADYDLSFWMQQAATYGDPILELGCGTGRIAIPLAQAGYQVTGIDASDPMLAQARDKSAREGVDVTWVRGDVRDFDLGGRFRLVIFPANAFLHLLDLEDMEACLGRVRRHLAPEGRFAFDVFIPDLDILRRNPMDQYPFSEYADPAGGEDVVVMESNVYDPITQINTITLYRREPEGMEVVLGQLRLRMLFPQELDALLRYNGFAIDHKYGNYDCRPFDTWAVRQLVVCHAAGDAG